LIKLKDQSQSQTTKQQITSTSNSIETAFSILQLNFRDLFFLTLTFLDSNIGGLNHA